MNMMDIAHFNMVEQQIRPWNVHDSRLLKQMSELDRCHFVPEEQRALCWTDTMIHLDDGSRMLEPKMAARMIQALDIKQSDKVLVVGAGSGYVAALCSGLATSVECVDMQQAALDRASTNCALAGIRNVQFLKIQSVDDLPRAHYDAIFLRARRLSVPDEYLHRVNDSGRCVALVGGDHLMELICYTCHSGELIVDSIVDILTDADHRLAGSSEPKEAFVF